MVTRRKSEDALFDEPSSSGAGPVYQGVCGQIRHLFPKTDEAAMRRKDELAGTIAQARSLAASIDRVSGHRGGPQANGVPLSALHAQLDMLLERLAGGGQVDPFQELLDELNGQAVKSDRGAQAPHPTE
jgi:hypothetical protein